jgi:hypothetical protein
MSDIYGDMVGNRPREYPCFLLAGDKLGNALHFYLDISQSVYICYSVMVAEKVSNTLWAFPKEWPIPFRDFLNGLHELLDTFPIESRHNLGISFTFFSKQRVSVH